MDQNQLIERLFDKLDEVRDKVSGIEAKLEIYNGLNQKMTRLEERLSCLEGAPGKKWSTLTTTIITAIVTGLVSFAIFKLTGGNAP